MTRRLYAAIFIYFILATIFFLPYFLQPKNLLHRNNDLDFFARQYLFFKREILTNHHLPLWQNTTLAGAPFLGDPQNPLVYLPNYPVLVMPFEIFLLTFLFSHVVLCGIGTIVLTQSFTKSLGAQLTAAMLFSFSPLLTARLEAGHLGMIAAISYFPLFVYGLHLSRVERSIRITSILALTLSAAFLNYFTIFFYYLVFGAIYLIYQRKTLRPNIIFFNFATSAILFVLICAPQLYAAAQIMNTTTRDKVTISDVGPTFLSIRRFVKSIIVPVIEGNDNATTETVLYVGFSGILLATANYFTLRRKQKIIIALGLAVAIFIALGVKTHLMQLLLQKIPQLLIFRITTRHWFIVALIVALLSAKAVAQIKKRVIIFVICALICMDMFIFNYRYFHIHPVSELPAASLFIKSLGKEPGYFRLYCPTNCLPDLTQYNKGSVNGYNPIQLSNYYYYFQKAAGYRFESYAVSLPPFQTYSLAPQPNAKIMGTLGVRYVLSPYALSDENFVPRGTDGNLLVYENERALPHAYVQSGEEILPVTISEDIPGKMHIDTNSAAGTLIVSEPYTSGWRAYSNNGDVSIDPKEPLLTLQLNEQIKTITVQYLPRWIYTLFIVSISATLYALLALLFQKRISKT